MGHAGAIVQGEVGRYETKIEKLKQANVKIANKLDDVVNLIKENMTLILDKKQLYI